MKLIIVREKYSGNTSLVRLLTTSLSKLLAPENYVWEIEIDGQVACLQGDTPKVLTSEIYEQISSAEKAIIFCKQSQLPSDVRSFFQKEAIETVMICDSGTLRDLAEFSSPWYLPLTVEDAIVKELRNILGDPFQGIFPFVSLLHKPISVKQKGLFSTPSVIIPQYSCSVREESPLYAFLDPNVDFIPSQDLTIATLSHHGNLIRPLVTYSLDSFLKRCVYLDIRLILLSPLQPEFLFWIGLAQNLGLTIALSSPSQILDSLGVAYSICSSDTFSVLQNPKILKSHKEQLQLEKQESVESVLKTIVNLPQQKHEINQTRISQKETVLPTPSVSFCIQAFIKDPLGLCKTLASIKALGITEYEVIVAGACTSSELPDHVCIPLLADAMEKRFGVIRNALIAQATKDVLIFCTPDIDFKPEFSENLREVFEIPEVAALRVLNPDGTRYWDWFVLNEQDHMLLDYEDFHPSVCLPALGFLMRRDVAEKISLSSNVCNESDFGMKELSALFSRQHIEPSICTTLEVSHRVNEISQFGRRVITKATAAENEVEVSPGLKVVGVSETNQSGFYRLTNSISIIVSEENLRYPSIIRFTLSSNPEKLKGRTFELFLTIPSGEVSSLILSESQPHCSIECLLPQSYNNYLFTVASSQEDSSYIHDCLLSELSVTETEDKHCIAGVHWHSDIFDFGGYASLARMLIRQLTSKDIPVDISSLSYEKRFIDSLSLQSSDKEMWISLTQRRIQRGVGIMLYTPSTPDDEGCFSRFKRKRSYLDYFIGMTMLEVDRIPQSWVDECNVMDEVWVPSNFCAKVFKECGVKREKIQVIPIGINTQRFTPKNEPLFTRTETFRFLSIFQWNDRKGWDVLIESYLKAFTSEDNVELIIRSYPDRYKDPSIQERIYAEVCRHGFTLQSAPKITHIEEFISVEDMPRLYTTADCFVLPTRGEGIGLPVMEAMASGTPVLTTAWSGQMDFLNEQNSFLIKVDGFEEVPLHHRLENPHYRRDMKWACPSVEHCVELMQRVVRNPEEARCRAERAFADIQHDWTVERTGIWIKNRLNTIIRDLSISWGESPRSEEQSHEISNHFHGVHL
jgi:glycosyltransferase involved in cell wall biosynthesis